MIKRINIVIAESSAILRCGIAALLHRASIANVDIIELADPSQLLSGSFKQIPDILIINPVYVGVSLPEQIKTSITNEQAKIVALQSTVVEQSTLQNYDAIISIYDSLDAIKQTFTDLIEDEVVEQEDRKDLSAREKEIVVLVVKGMTNKQIADTLFLSAHTVIAHRRNIASKLQIHSPSGLTIYAIVNKLVNLADIKNTISQVGSSDI